MKDTAFQIWNDLKEGAPEPLDGAVEHGQLTACTKRRKNFGTVVFWHFIWIHRNFSVQMKRNGRGKKHIISGNRRSGEKKSVVWSATGKKQETLQTMKDYFQQLKGLAPKTFAGEVYNLYMYLWNRLVLSDELLENWMEAEKILRENEILK